MVKMLGIQAAHACVEYDRVVTTTATPQQPLDPRPLHCAQCSVEIRRLLLMSSLAVRIIP